MKAKNQIKRRATSWRQLKCLLTFGLVFCSTFKSLAALDRPCVKILKTIGSELGADDMDQEKSLSVEDIVMPIYSSDAKERREGAYRFFELLSSDDYAEADPAFWMVETFDERALPALFDIFFDSSENKHRRRQAALILQRMAHPESLAVMKEALKSSETWVRVQAATILGEIGSLEAREALLEAARDADLEVKKAAQSAVSMLLTVKRQKTLIAMLAKSFNLKKPTDWYQISKSQIRSMVGLGLLNQFNGSPAEMVMALVDAPEGGWKPWLFERVPRGFWDHLENQKEYIKWLGEQLGFKEPKDWYQVTKDLIEENSGRGLLQKFNGSPAEMVMKLVDAPEGGWRPWLFGKVPQNYWENPDNQKEYIKWLGERLGYKEPKDWYKLTADLIKENSGRGLLFRKFNGSAAEMVMAILKDQAPEGGWKPWLFGKVPGNYWDDPDNQKEYIKWLGEQLGYTKPEDWYKLTTGLIRENSGRGLLQKFNGSPLSVVGALVDAPEGGWLPWMSRSAPNGFWNNLDNQKAYITWLGEQLGFTKPEDWYQVTKDLIQENSGSRLLDKFRGSPAEMVMKLVDAPEGGWVKDKFFSQASKNETRMSEILTGWFKDLNFNITNNDRKTHGLTFEGSGRGMGADVLFDELKFAIEYHGIQHYEALESWGGQAVFGLIQKRDQEKRETFKNAGYIYIEIPYDKWTDGSPETLKNLILEQLLPYEKSSSPEVKARAARIREALSR